MELKEEKREVHTLNAPSFNAFNSKDFVVPRFTEELYSDNALLDFASTYTILRNLVLFGASCMRKSWLSCDIFTIARRRNFNP